MASTLSGTFRCPIPARTHRSIPLLRLPSPVARFPTRVRWSAIRVAAASAAGSSSQDGEFNPYEIRGVNPFVGFDKVERAYTKRRKEVQRDGDDAAVTRVAASAAGSSPDQDGEFNPYEILGVNPFAGFDKVKRAYTKKRKEAERDGDDAAVTRLEKAYDELMMSQLMGRKKGVVYGSLKVSEDIKYADKQPIIPWGPRFARSSVKDIRINLAISAAFIAWTLFQPNVEYKSLQFLAFAFVYRIFEKLKSFEPAASTTYSDDGVEDGRALRIGKRAFRALSLVFGCIAFASLAYTGSLNLSEMAKGYVPAVLYNNQEPIVTVASAILLFIVGSFYR